jgi:hypothetical protein
VAAAVDGTTGAGAGPWWVGPQAEAATIATQIFEALRSDDMAAAIFADFSASYVGVVRTCDGPASR